MASPGGPVLKFKFPKNTPLDELKYFFEFIARHCQLLPFYYAGFPYYVSRKDVLHKFRAWVDTNQHPVSKLVKQQVFYELLPTLFHMLAPNESRFRITSGSRTSPGYVLTQLQWRTQPNLHQEYDWEKDVKLDAFGSFSFFGQTNSPPPSTDSVATLFKCFYDFEAKFTNYTIAAFVCVESLKFLYAPPLLRLMCAEALVPELHLDLDHPNQIPLKKTHYEPDGVIRPVEYRGSFSKRHKAHLFPQSLREHTFSSLFVLVMPYEPVIDFAMLIFSTHNVKFSLTFMRSFTENIRHQRNLLGEHPHKNEMAFDMMLKEAIYDPPFPVSPGRTETKKRWCLELMDAMNETDLNIHDEETDSSSNEDSPHLFYDEDGFTNPFS